MSELLDKFFPIDPVLKFHCADIGYIEDYKPDSACERYRYDSRQMHCQSHQPIKDMSFD